MQRVFDYIVRFKEYIVLVILTVMCFSFMSYGSVGQLGGFRSLVIATIGVVQSAFAWLPNPVALKAENSALRDLNMQLSREVVKMRQSVIENEKLRALLNFKATQRHPLLACEVVGKSTSEFRSYITINRGSIDGIQEGMTVVTDAGLVGVTIGVSSTYSLVQLLLNRDSRIASRNQRTREEGIIVWEGTEYLVMKNIPRTANIQTNDAIISSTLSRRFAPDFVIGYVSEVVGDPKSLFRKVLVRPAVNFTTLEQVFVIMTPPDKDRYQLEKRIEEKIQQKLRDE
jgi:rod shape-determining protein MreC